MKEQQGFPKTKYESTTTTDLAN